MTGCKTWTREKRSTKSFRFYLSSSYVPVASRRLAPNAAVDGPLFTERICKGKTRPFSGIHASIPRGNHQNWLDARVIKLVAGSGYTFCIGRIFRLSDNSSRVLTTDQCACVYVERFGEMSEAAGIEDRPSGGEAAKFPHRTNTLHAEGYSRGGKISLHVNEPVSMQNGSMVKPGSTTFDSDHKRIVQNFYLRRIIAYIPYLGKHTKPSVRGAVTALVSAVVGPSRPAPDEPGTQKKLKACGRDVSALGYLNLSVVLTTK
ncbi:hypothetical protein EVAR_3339_1 [Eumeta japonica]|uniref:Uncharacterized protein n=1 Tax=Eumeta variegata TaxID=151549 RepID=A0A4C1SS68_EUMVA|nr:hypothetical protein EVAR_3339_1 [Eumeta japonica]